MGKQVQAVKTSRDGNGTENGNEKGTEMEQGQVSTLGLWEELYLGKGREEPEVWCQGVLGVVGVALVWKGAPQCGRCTSVLKWVLQIWFGVRWHGAGTFVCPRAWVGIEI